MKKINFTSNMPFYVFLAFLLFFLIGCTPKVVTDTTKQTALNVANVNAEIIRYRGILEGDSSNRIGYMSAEKERKARLETTLQLRFNVWELSGQKDKMELVKRISNAAKQSLDAERSVVDQLQKLKSDLRATQEAYNVQSGELDSLKDQLNNLSNPASPIEMADFLLAYFKSVKDEIDKMEKEAKEKKENADKKQKENIDADMKSDELDSKLDESESKI